jgi:hypothetical protein
VEMEEYAQARAESWQESERGEEFQERLEAVQEVLAAVEELTAGSEKTPSKPLTEDLSCLVVLLVIDCCPITLLTYDFEVDNFS